MKNNKIINSIDNNIERIASAINMPFSNKRLIFLFGSGINFNIAKNPLDWDGLTKRSLKNYFSDIYNVSKEKKYNDFEIDSITDKIIKNLNNKKLALSFCEKENLKLKIIPKDPNEYNWFLDGLAQLHAKMNSEIEIVTLNYDLVLEKILGRISVNILTNEPKNVFKEIIHLHGVVDEMGVVSKDSILNLRDYALRTPEVEKLLLEYLTKYKNEKSSYETIVIIGSSLEEEHILRTLKKYNKIGHKNIFLIDHLPNDEIYLERMERVYAEFGITLININRSNSYEKDFIYFWNALSQKIKNNFFDDFKKIDNKSKIIDIELYRQIKTNIPKNKIYKDYHELFNDFEIDEYNNPQFIRVVHWLENEKKLQKGSLKNFMLNKDRFDLSNIEMLENYSLDEGDVDFILDRIEDDLAVTSSSKFYLNEFKTLNFIKSKIKNKSITKKNMINKKNILSFLIKKSLKSDRFKNSKKNDDNEILNFLKNNFSYKEIKKYTDFFNSHFIIWKYPEKNDLIYSLFENDFEKGQQPLEYEKFDNFEGFINFLKWDLPKFDRLERFTIFLFDPFEGMILSNWKKVIRMLDTRFLKESEIYWAFKLHVLLYFVMIKSEFKSEYLTELKGAEHFITSEFPSDIDILGHGGTSTPNFSDYDGSSIKNKIIEVTSDDQMKEILERENISLDEKKSIINYLNRNFNEDIYKFIIQNEKIGKWFFFQNVGSIIKKCKTWDEYLEYSKVSTKLGGNNTWRLVKIEPPYEIHERETELINYLFNVFDDSKFEELIKIMDIKLIKGHYSESYLWQNNDISVCMEYLKKNGNKKASKILWKIFKKIFKWKKIDQDFKNVIEESNFGNDINKWQLAIRSSDKYKPIKIKEIIGMYVSKGNGLNYEFLNMADFNIRLMKSKKWNTEFIELIKFVKDIDSSNRWIKTFESRVIYNIIVNKNNIKVTDGFIPTKSSIFRVIRLIDENENKINKKISEYDEEISDLLNNVDKFDKFDSIFQSIRFISNIEKLGKKTIESIFELIMIELNKLPVGKYFYYYNDLKNFYKVLDSYRIKEIKSTLEDNNIHGLNE